MALSKVDVLTAILDGSMDDHRDAIVDAIKARDRQLRAQKQAMAAATLTVGTKVSIVDITPKALVGIEGTIAALRGARADLKVDDLNARLAGPRFALGGVVRGIPVTCLKVAS